MSGREAGPTPEEMGVIPQETKVKPKPEVKTPIERMREARAVGMIKNFQEAMGILAEAQTATDIAVTIMERARGSRLANSILEIFERCAAETQETETKREALEKKIKEEEAKPAWEMDWQKVIGLREEAIKLREHEKAYGAMSRVADLRNVLRDYARAFAYNQASMPTEGLDASRVYHLQKKYEQWIDFPYNVQIEIHRALSNLPSYRESYDDAMRLMGKSEV